MSPQAKEYIRLYLSIPSNLEITDDLFDEMDSVWYSLSEQELRDVEEISDMIKNNQVMKNKNVDEIIEKWEKLKILK